MRAKIKGRWVWKRETNRPLRLANSLTEPEQANVRRAIRHLQLALGSLVELSKAMGVPYQSVRHALVERRKPSAAFMQRHDAEKFLYLADQ